MTTSFSDLLKADREIQTFRDRDPNLDECRGYVFSLNGAEPGVSEDRVDAIIMGMNPGEAPERDDGVSPASKGNWSRLCQSAADSVGGKWTISEMFFWSSHDLAALRKRVGDFSPYLEFCATQNLVMIAYHRPKVVFQPGLGWLRDAVRFYNLTKV
jgi:hypothetical protein